MRGRGRRRPQTTPPGHHHHHCRRRRSCRPCRRRRRQRRSIFMQGGWGWGGVRACPLFNRPTDRSTHPVHCKPLSWIIITLTYIHIQRWAGSGGRCPPLPPPSIPTPGQPASQCMYTHTHTHTHRVTSRDAQTQAPTAMHAHPFHPPTYSI